MLLVVRHAEAGPKGSWDGPDVLRPLSPVGRLQAQGLVVRLEDYPVERILCSPSLRCRQTVQPLARDRLLGIEEVAALGVDAGPGEVVALFWDRGLQDACCAPMARRSGGCSGSWSPVRSNSRLFIPLGGWSEAGVRLPFGLGGLPADLGERRQVTCRGERQAAERWDGSPSLGS
jgi:hypothetical protein